MNICVFGSQNVRHDIESVGAAIYLKYPRVFSVMAQSFLYDPLLVGGVGDVPEVWELMSGEPREAMRKADLVVVPHAVREEDEAALLNYIEQGGKVLWVRPSDNALRRATAGQVERLYTLNSHRERWHLPGGDFFYAQMLRYDSYRVDAGEGMWPIGEVPGLVRLPGLTVCGGDLFFAHMWYLNSPRDLLTQAGEANAFQTMILGEVARLLGIEMETSEPAPRFFLRRDFHAYGYTRRMVEDLFALHGKAADFTVADGLLCRAARAFAESESDGVVEELLRPAFAELKRLRDLITDIPVYYADGMHGGILTEDYGYIEIGEPEFVVELFRMFLELGYKRGYHFACDVSIATFVHLAKRYPAFIEDMKKGMDAGIFEVANGSIGQLYPHLFGMETNVHQFISGQAAMEKLFGRRAESFLAQEMQFTPAYASLLAQSGYKGTLHRIQNKGATVYDGEVSVKWRAPGGDAIPCIPTHYDDSQQSISTGFALWPQLITETAKHYPMGIYTNLLDIVWITLFREETVRASHYAPVMGTFVTYTELFDMLRPQRERTYERADYLPEMQPGTSKMLGDMAAVGRTLEAVEKYAALARREDMNRELTAAWDGLGEFVNHDNTVCFHVRPKDQAFLPFATGPDRRGPELYDVLEGMTYRRLKAVTDKLGAADALFNPLHIGQTVRLVRTEGEWRPLKRLLDPETVRAVTEVAVPPLSTAGIPGAADMPAVRGDTAVLDNGLLRAELNLKTGALRSVRHAGEELLAADANYIAAGMEGVTELVSWRQTTVGGVQSLDVHVRMRYPDGRDGGEAHSCVSLADGARTLMFTTRVEPNPKIVMRQRTYPHDREDGIGVVHHFKPAYATVRDCWMHHLHGRASGQPRVYGPGLYYGSRTLEREYLSLDKGHITQSPMGLVVEASGRPSLILHSDGPSIYEAQDGTVRNLLWCSYEYGDTYSYALEVLREGDAYDAMLRYQYELLPVPSCALYDVPKVTGAWLSAHYLKDGCFYTRIAETRGAACRAVIELHRPSAEVWRVNLLGDRVEPVAAGARIAIELLPHGIATVCYRFA